MATIGVSTRNGVFHLRTPFRFKDWCKSLTGSRWDRSNKSWTVPASPYSAREIALSAPSDIAGDTSFWEFAETDTNPAICFDQPAIRRHDLWRHQCGAYRWANDRDASLLAMDMGTGKTLAVLALIENNRFLWTLVLCPKSVLGVWRREVEKHCIHPTITCAPEGSTVRRLSELQAAVIVQREFGASGDTFEPVPPLILVVNYETAIRKVMKEWLLNQEWDLVVADESHRLKSPSGITSRFAWKLGGKAKKRIALTGTPMPNNQADLFGQYRFLDPAIFGTTWTAFKAKYVVEGPFKNIERFKNTTELHERFHRLAYVVGPEVLDLPPTTDQQIEVTLPTTARDCYASLENNFMAELNEGLVTASNVLVKLLRLSQVTSGFVTDEFDTHIHLHAEKQSALIDLLDGMPTSENVVVFCRFAADLDAVKKSSDKLNRKYGEISGRSKSGLSDLGTLAEGIQVCGVQWQAGGVGIDLSSARYAVVYSQTYSLGDYLQARKRIHRPGQDRPVTYYHLVATNTVDEEIYSALERKQSVAEMMLKRVPIPQSAVTEHKEMVR